MSAESIFTLHSGAWRLDVCRLQDGYYTVLYRNNHAVSATGQTLKVCVQSALIRYACLYGEKP